MALDTSRLRKRLPPPPVPEDGSPALDELPIEQPRAARPTPATPTRDEGVPVRDGRSLRATGRTAQLNLKVRPETRARMLALAEARGLLLAEVLEQAIEALEKRKPAR